MPDPPAALDRTSRSTVPCHRRERRFFSGRARFLFGLLVAGTVLVSDTGAEVEILPPGHRPVALGVHALVGGKVILRPGETLDPGTVVIRDGLIEAVGRDLKPPADARVWDMKGLTVYAGLIDAYLSLTPSEPPVTTSRAEPILTSGGVNFYGVPGGERDPGQPGPGSELPTVTPENRVAKSFAPDGKTLASLRELGFAAANVVPTRGILRGTSAFVSLSDVNPNDAIINSDVFQSVAFEADGDRERGYPASLMGVIAAVRQTFFDAQHYVLDQSDYPRHPAGRRRPEFNPALAALAPALDRRMPVVFEPGSSLMVDRAARVARELGLRFYVLASGQEWRRPALAKAAGVPFIVPLHFPEVSKLPEDDDWNEISLDQLRAWDWAPENAAILHQLGIEMALTTYGLSDRKPFRKNLRQALDRGLPEAAALAALTTVPARLCGLADRLGTIEPGKFADLTIVSGNYFDPETKVRGVWIDGRYFPSPPEPGRTGGTDSAKGTEAGASREGKAKGEKKQADQRDLLKHRVAHSPEEGRGPIVEPAAVLIEGATIWTCGPAGRLEGADLLAVGGRIRAVGRGLSARNDLPKGTMKIDGRDRQVTPGLIDCHNHSMILGAVNEGTIPSSAMVRVGDVVNSESENLHAQLAGGVTTVNLLHGSANPIGGQNCVIKLRDGATPEALKLEGAPPGIKFALGENVKQSNWGGRNPTRFPQTRMGVETFIANRFIAAQQYLRDWAKSKQGGGLAPRRDLELEALGEILQHQRWIHCHSYRQDEILMLIRLMDRFGVQVGTFQHVLEGYKVADEIAAHGAGASTFSDWWAYKFEVYDAIPYNGSLMRERGVLVSFNSDSSDLARRLYLEAAKAVKYGGTPEVEALDFVTINPARQLRIDARVGSLEPGKDADFVIWSKSPLDSGTVCRQTWIDGKKYFDRDLEADRITRLEKERAALLAKVKKTLAGGMTDEAGAGEKQRFFQRALEHRDDGLDRHCLDED